MNVLNRNVRYLLMALLFACANHTYAYIVISDGIYYDYIPEGNFVSVVKRYDSGTNTLTPYTGSVIIPASVEVNGKNVPVKYIATDAFQGCTSLTYVSLPKSIVKINSRAFFGCTGLSSIFIPTSVTEIGQAAFYNCTGLETLENFENSKVKTIGANAFCQCSSLTQINLPNSLESIENNAFENATPSSMNINITLPQTLKRIGDKAFAGVRISSLHIPSSVVSIGAKAFDTYNCTSITVDEGNNVYDSHDNCNAIIDKWNGTLILGCNYTTIPDGLTGIASYAFSNCLGISSVVIPSSVTSIGSYAFFNCINLRKVVIFGAVTELQESCFNLCPISELVLPETLKKIGTSALNSLRVESLTLPSSLYFIAEGAISSSTIKSIKFPATISYLGSRSVVLSANSIDMTFAGDVPGYVAEDAFGAIEGNSNPLSRIALKVTKEFSDNFVGSPWNQFASKEILVETDDEGGTITEEIVPVDNVELYDGQSYTYKGYRKAETLTYIRNFGNTNWQAWYVPFPMAYNDWKDNFEVARLNAIRMYDSDDDGEYDETELEIIKVKSGNIYPNHPYFIKAKNEGAYTFTLNNVVVYPAESKSIDCSTVETQFALTGTYDVVPGVEMVSNKYYALSKGQLCYTTNINAYLNPNRWYMKISERSSQVYYTVGLARVRVNVRGEANEDVLDEEVSGTELFDAEGAATCISDLTSDDADAPVFALEGIRVDATGTLRPGIYIKNGKKIIVK